MTTMAEAFETEIEHEIEEQETAPMPSEQLDLQERVAALQGVVAGLGLSERKLIWLQTELANLTLPPPRPGPKVKWARLVMDDWAKWAEEIRKERVKQARLRIATDMKMTPLQRLDALQQIDERDVSLGELSDLVRTPRGAQRILQISLMRAGVTDEKERDRIINQYDPMRQLGIAFEVASILNRATSVEISPIPQDDPPAGTFGRPDGPFAPTAVEKSG